MFDLDGDGVELAPADGSVLFDHDADGVRTGTQWVRPDDGLLVRDRDGNGTIDSGRELFGDQQALAQTHAEFILIHPFREGNGRLARLLNTLMALQAGLPLLDFDGIRGAAKQRYIASIHAAQGHDYAPLERVFAAVLRRTQRVATSSSVGADR